MADERHLRRLLELLFYRFEAEGTALYALLDAARDPAIYPLLERSGVEHACLFTGQLSRTLLAASPFLVRVVPNAATCEQLIDRGWGRAWNVFLASRSGLHQVRRHLRTLLEVRSPERNKLYFRYYDPRVLRVFLPTCDSAQLRQVFGPIDRFDMEAADRDQLVRFRTVSLPSSAVAPSPATTLRTWTYALSALDDDAADDRGRVAHATAG